MALQFTENRQRNIGLSLTSNPRTVLRSNGLAEATQAEALAGTIQHRYISPLRLSQYIANEATGDLTKVDDTNVTLTLGGTPTDSLWNDVSVTVGWSGTLAAARGGWGADISAQSGIPILTAGVSAFFAPAAGVQTFLTTPSSANLATAVTDETGSGALVFATSPTLVTPILGVASATSINKVALTAPATSATLTIADGKTLTASNTLTFTGTDASSVAFGTGGTVAYTGGTLAQFAATTSAQLAGVISDETGSGALVFGTSPVFTTDITVPNTGLHLLDTDASHDLIIKPGSDLNADRTFTLTTGNADRTLDISAGSVTISTAGAALIDDADASAQRTTLGLGTASVKNTGASGDAVPLLNIANTFSADQTFSNTVAGAGPFTAQTTEDSATSGPIALLNRISASPAASDVMGAFVFFGRDSLGNATQYGNVQSRIIDPTDASEDSEFGFATQIAGSFDFRMFVGNGIIVGSPTGGYKGNGTLNATAVYDDNVLLTDVVQEWAATGAVDLARWDGLVPDRFVREVREQIAVMDPVEVDAVFTRVDPIDGSRVAEKKKIKRQLTEWVPIFDADGNGIDAVERPVFDERVTPARVEKREHYGARIFKQLLDDGLNPKDPESFANYIKTKRALPGLPTEAEWQHGKFSIGELQTRSTLAMEILTQAFIGLSDRVALLEKK